MRKLPPMGPRKAPKEVFSSLCVNLIPLTSFFKFNGVLYIDTNIKTPKTSNNPKFKSKQMDSEFGYSTIYYPVISFDGCLVLLMNNITDEHKKLLYYDNFVPSYNTYESKNNDFKIEFYDIEDPDLLNDLSIEGMKQLKNLYVSLEKYTAAAIVRNAIDDDILLEKHEHIKDKPNINKSPELIAREINLPIVK